MINIENLKEFLGSDEEFIVTLMDKFMAEIPKDGANLKRSANECDWARTRAISHKMLSSTKIFNLDDMTSLLQKIEKYSGNKEHLNQIRGLIDNFENASKKVMKDMKLQREMLAK